MKGTSLPAGPPSNLATAKAIALRSIAWLEANAAAEAELNAAHLGVDIVRQQAHV